MFAFFDTSIYNELPQDSQGVQDMKWFNQHFRGTERVEIEVKGPLTNFEVFQSVEKLQDELRQIPGVSGVSSYATLLRYMGPSGVLDYEDGIGPASKALNSLPEYPINIINKGMNHACIIFYTSSEFGSAQYRNFKAKFEELLPNLPKEAEFKMNGYVNMAYNSINYITDSLFYSLGVSILAITLVMMIYLRSIVFALLCLVPNVLPIAVTLGLAGWFNIPVGVGIIVILIIGLGLAVDDTVHLVIKFIDNKKKGEQVSVKESLDQAVSTTGYAIVITSVVILVAAATFMQSSFSTLNETGMVLGVVTVSAILADLFVFPWVLEKYYAVLQNLKLS
jgi:predicted RND superfamily exporter protein